jgi:hypothetical protein
MKAKRSSRKREHSLNDKSEKWSFLANEKRVHLLQKKFFGVQPFIAANKTKQTESKSKDAPRKTHSA